MSEYEGLRSEIMTVMDSLNEYGRTVNRYMAVVNDQVAAVWADNAELRDEINAVANRLESLTRARPAVNDAERMLRVRSIAEDVEAVCGDQPGIGSLALAIQLLAAPVDPAEVAAAIVNDANRETLRAVLEDDRRQT